MSQIRICGSGSYLPKKSLSNQVLESTLDTSDEWIYTRTGIKSRHIANEEESTSFMAAQAALSALKAAALCANDIDLIIVATCTPNFFFPNVACYVQKALNIQKPIPAFDVNVACSGFIYAMDIAKHYLDSGTAKHVLVIGSESMSKAVDWTDRSTAILFGDGAGAVVLGCSENEGGILGTVLHAAYDEEAFLTYLNPAFLNPALKQEASFINMKGNEVFKIAVNIMGDIVDEVLQKSQVQQSDIDWLIPHQANIRIIQALAKKLNLSMDRVVVTIESQGNTSAASIPLALDHAIRSQRIKRGDLLLLESFGGGMTWGALLLRY